MIDKDIPYLVDWLSGQAEVCALSSEEVAPELLSSADALFCRTVTQVGPALLADSAIRFVGAASAGFNHLDVRYLDEAGIAWSAAPGCNAHAVVNYVEGVLRVLPRSPQQIGIVGCGAVGSTLYNALSGQAVSCYDPPRALRDVDFHSCSKAELLQCDVLCVHAALTYDDHYPSFHLLDDAFLRKLAPGTAIINAARGELIDEQALLHCADRLRLCLDVWTGEPTINRALVEKAFIATPHVAGYSQRAKFNAARQVYEAAQPVLGLQPLCEIVPPPLPAPYDALADSLAFKRGLLDERLDFAALRRAYSYR